MTTLTRLYGSSISILRIILNLNLQHAILGDDLQGLDLSDPDILERMIRNRERVSSLPSSALTRNLTPIATVLAAFLLVGEW